MAKYTEQQIHNIYLHCNAAPLDQLLQLCLDTTSGITVQGLEAAHYNRIELLKQRYFAQAEEIAWAEAQGSVDKLVQYVQECHHGAFSTAHLAEAETALKQLVAKQEEKDWREASLSGDVDRLKSYLEKCATGVYSNCHEDDCRRQLEELHWNRVCSSRSLNSVQQFLTECQQGVYSSLHQAEARQLAEELHWEEVRSLRQVEPLRAFYTLCQNGTYPGLHASEAQVLLEELENGPLMQDWRELEALPSSHPQKLILLRMFLQKYQSMPSATPKAYVKLAQELLQVVLDWESAHRDWQVACDKDNLLAYQEFLDAHPQSDYAGDARQRIHQQKGYLLYDMKRRAFAYNRDEMYQYISSGVLSREELVDESEVLTDRAYDHIRKYPSMQIEWPEMPVSLSDHPESAAGNTDVYFFGIPGSGKTCVLAGLLSLTGQFGFQFDPKGAGGGGNYAVELRKYARTSMLPPPTDKKTIQVIDAEIRDTEKHLHPISFIEMSGEMTAQYAAMKHGDQLDDLGPGAQGLLTNGNEKVIFFVIDPVNEKELQLGTTVQTVQQSDMLDCVVALLAHSPNLMRKVKAIHVILAKSDTLGDHLEEGRIRQLLNQQGYQQVFSRIDALCQKYTINKSSGLEVGMYPFSFGKFMPGEVYTFDDTDSRKILQVIQENSTPRRADTGGVLDAIERWFNC